MRVQIDLLIFETTQNKDGTWTSVCLNTKEEKSIPIVTTEGLLGTFPSNSGSDPHRVQYKPGLGIYCTCLGYGYRRYCRCTKFIQNLIDTRSTTIEELLKQPIEVTRRL